MQRVTTSVRTSVPVSRSRIRVPAAAALAAILSLPGAVDAQGTCHFVPDNVQSGSNVIPFGSTSLATWGNQRYQMLVLPADVGNTPITIHSLAVSGAGTGIRHHDTIEIKFDYFQGTGTTLSTTFASNMTSSPTTVLKSSNYAWHQVGNTWSTIGLQTPFTYVPQLGSLVVEITLTGSLFTGSGSAGLHNAGSGSPITRPRLYSVGWSTLPTTGSVGSTAAIRLRLCTDEADASTFGHGCAGSNSQVPTVSLTGTGQINTKLGVGMTGGLPTSPAFLAVGLQPFTMPIDLQIAGAPGCMLYHSQDIVVPALTDASGNLGNSFGVPNSKSVLNVRVYVQFGLVDAKANPLGITTSDFARILIGL